MKFSVQTDSLQLKLMLIKEYIKCRLDNFFQRKFNDIKNLEHIWQSTIGSFKDDGHAIQSPHSHFLSTFHRPRPSLTVSDHVHETPHSIVSLPPAFFF